MDILADVRRSREAWDSLTATEKRDAILVLIDDGYSEDVVARATGLSIEMIRQLVASRNPAA